MEIHIPALCERPRTFRCWSTIYKETQPELRRNFRGIDDEVIRVLMSLPGRVMCANSTIIEHTMILAEGDHIS
jgi:hypothetical protein